MPSDPREPLRVYLTWHEADRPHGERVCQYLQRPMETEGFTVWHPGKPLPGDHYQDALRRERADADLRVMLLSIDLLNSDEFKALCALPPGLAIRVGPCDQADPALAGWRCVDKTPVNQDTLYAAAQEIRTEVAALRKKRADGQTAPPPGDDPTQARVEQLASKVAEHLAGAPQLKESLARQLGLAPDATSRQVAQALVRQPSREVVAMLDAVDRALDKDRAEPLLRHAARRLLFQVLPLATDFRGLLTQGWDRAGAARSIALPFDSATLAEVAIAGLDERLCSFGPSKSTDAPVGFAAIHVAAAARTALFDVDHQIKVEAVVRTIGARLAVDTNLDDAALRRAVRGQLRRHAEDVPAEERLPYYMVFESGVFGAATESTWTLVRDRIGSALPSLRLVRLTGGADDPEDNEWRLVYALRDLLRRDP